MRVVKTQQKKRLIEDRTNEITDKSWAPVREIMSNKIKIQAEELHRSARNVFIPYAE